MDVKTDSINDLETAKVQLSNIPNVQTQAALRDADAWVAEMRAKESKNSKKNNSLQPILILINKL